MSRRYKFWDQQQVYFISFAVVYWIDVFIRNEYKDVLLDSWRFCIKNKGLQVWAWCIMPSHVHMIIGTEGEKMQDIVRDMKSFTSTQIKAAIINHNQESRREWMLAMMKKAGTLNNQNKDFQFWQQHNHPIELNSIFLIEQKLDYLHNNPVAAGFVVEPEHWLYSSANDYAGGQGLLGELKIIE